jgi:hypothetical protein
MVDWILWTSALAVLATMLMASQTGSAEEDGGSLCGDAGSAIDGVGGGLPAILGERGGLPRLRAGGTSS